MSWCFTGPSVSTWRGSKSALRLSSSTSDGPGGKPSSPNPSKPPSKRLESSKKSMAEAKGWGGTLGAQLDWVGPSRLTELQHVHYRVPVKTKEKKIKNWKIIKLVKLTNLRLLPKFNQTTCPDTHSLFEAFFHLSCVQQSSWCKLTTSQCFCHYPAPLSHTQTRAPRPPTSTAIEAVCSATAERVGGADSR